MRVRGWLVPIAIFAFMFIVALIIPATREVAITCSRVAAQTLSLAKDIGSDLEVFGVAAHLANMERAANQKDATILLGTATGGIMGHGEQNIRVLGRAAELDTDNPVIRTALIQVASHALYSSEFPVRTKRLTAAETERHLAIIEENAHWGMQHDPDNALFFFATAYAHALRGKTNEAKDLFVEASQKKHLETYDKHILRARVKAGLASGGTEFGVRYLVLQSGDPGVFDFRRLSYWIAEEARKADAQGRKADAIRLDLANFDTGSLMYDMAMSSWGQPSGVDYMIRAIPDDFRRIPGNVRPEERYERQASALADHLLSHGVRQARVDRAVAGFRESANYSAHIPSLMREEPFRSSMLAIIVMAVSGMLLGGALLFGILWLLMIPATRLLAGRTRAEGWSMATSAVMWILLVAMPVSATLALKRLALSDTSVPAILLSMLFPPGHPAVAMLFIVFAVTAILLVRQIVVDAMSGREAKKAFGRSALLMGILIPEILILLVVPANMEVQRVQLVLAVTALCVLIVFSLLRAAIVRRRAGGGFEEHFFPSLLASIRAFALGAAAFGIIGIYVSIPYYYKAVEAMDRILR